MSTITYDAWKTLLEDRDLPQAIVDLDAFDRNVGRVQARLGGVSLRPATKSLRIPALMARLATLLGPRLSGWMLFSAREAELLTRHPETAHLDDLLIAYPIATRLDAERLARLADAGRTVRVVVDDAIQLALLAEAATPAARQTHLSVVLDLDAAWRPLERLIAGAHQPHIGVRRSPLRTPADAVALARQARAQGLRVSGLMAYEAQVAGMRDVNPASRALDPIRRLIRRASAPNIATRRAAVVAALRDAGFVLPVVNGGGSGSLDSTPSDPSVTEVTAGSGFLGSHLFEGYRALTFEAASFFALPVTRMPDPNHVTCAFGGFIASGAAGADRAPIVHLPRGLEPVGPEGFGEVQTPLRRGPDAPTDLGIGDPVICRHAKAGELFEHFNSVLLVSADTSPVAATTYRGLGLAHG